MAELIDPYGNDGADPDPQWSDEWSRWSGAARDDYLAKVPRLGPLKFAQMADILQGLPPRPSGWEAITTCTEEAYGAVARLRWEIERGDAPPAFTPAELRFWCEARGFEVPAVLASVRPSARQVENASADFQAGTDGIAKTAYPPWVPLGPGYHEKIGASNKRPVGRPATADVRNKRLVKIGKDFVLAEARQGRLPSLDDVVKYVESEPEAAGMARTSIRRRLTGELPLEQAKQIAHQFCKRVQPRASGRAGAVRARR